MNDRTLKIISDLIDELKKEKEKYEKAIEWIDLSDHHDDCFRRGLSELAGRACTCGRRELLKDKSE